jgi:hypothetical protein
MEKKKVRRMRKMRKIRHRVFRSCIDPSDPSYRFKILQVCEYCKYFSESKRNRIEGRCRLHPSYRFHGIEDLDYICSDWRMNLDLIPKKVK